MDDHRCACGRFPTGTSLDRALNIHLGYWNQEDGDAALRLLGTLRDAALATGSWDDQLQLLYDAYRDAIERQSQDVQFLHSSAKSMMHQGTAYLLAFLVEWALDGWAARTEISISQATSLRRLGVSDD